MKTKTLLNIGLIFSLCLGSCAPIYKCGTPKPEKEIRGSKRLLQVVEERDELCKSLETSKEENNFLLKNNNRLAVSIDSLKVEYDSLQQQNLQLNRKISDQVAKNLEQGHLYDERLREKEQLMKEKEENLKDREKRISDLERQIAHQDSISQRLNNLLHQALLSFNSDELTTEIKNGKVYVSMSDKLMFQSGKADVQKKGVEALGVLATILNKNEEFGILVEGHTDNVPIKTAKYADNWDLSVNRATAIVRILQEKYEVDPLRLTASGKGEFFPRASNETAEERAKNRRTEIIISPNLSELIDFLNK